VVAKDFAVLARFTDKSKNRPASEGFLKDYFLGGLRGLGTWGAAWFLDNGYHNFENLQEEDLQLLLEVIYRDGRIFTVKDVSNEPQEYFDSQNSKDRVLEVIDSYKNGRL
jgi:hypothetical protein